MKKIERALDLFHEVMYDDSCKFSTKDMILLDESQQELSELKQHLREIEWSALHARCPACRGYYSPSYDEQIMCNAKQGHKENCWLNKALKEDE